MGCLVTAAYMDKTGAAVAFENAGVHLDRTDSGSRQEKES